MKKLCAVVLFVFLASLFAAGAAFAVVRQIPDFGNPVGAAIRGTAVDGGGMVLSADAVAGTRIQEWGIHMIPVSSDFSSWISLVSKDGFTSTDFVVNQAVWSSDYDFLKARVNHVTGVTGPAFTFNVPDGVISLLKGGDNYLTAGASDVLGYTIQANAALQIVRHHSANPGTVHPQAYATDETDTVGAAPRQITAGDTTVVVPYMFRADVLPAVGRTIAMPVLLDQIGNNQTSAAGLSIGATNWNARNIGNAISRFQTYRFRGMRAQDVRMAKVTASNLATGSTSYVRQNAASTLGLHEFVVARGNTVLGVNDLLLGTERVIFKIADGTHDLSTAGDGVVVDPVIIWGDNPLVKFPDVRDVPVTTHQTMGYMPLTREGSGIDYNGTARAWPNPNSNALIAANLYPDYTRQQFEVVNGLLWHSNAAIAAWGGMNLQAAQVVKFPGTLASTFAGNSAMVVFTIRPGAGFHGGSIGLDQLVGRPISDLRVFSLTGNADEDREYEHVYNPAHLSTAHRDGTFAVLRPAANDPNFQEVITDPNHVFVAGGVYFLAVVARDGGDFDVDQGLQGNGQGKNNECVHFSVFAAVDATPSVTPTETPSVTPTETPSVTPSTAPSGGSSGGCSVGGFAPATLLLLAPLFLLLKK